MNFSFLHSGLVLGICAGLGNAVGGALITRSFAGRIPAAFTAGAQRALTQVGAGILLAIALLEFIPASLQSTRPHPWAAPLILTGYLLLHWVEHTVVPHAHGDWEDAPKRDVSPMGVYSTVLGLMVHSFFDGVAIGAAALLSNAFGILTFAAIMMHKVPLGATVASLALTAGLGARRALLGASLVGAATVVGVLLVKPMTVAQTGMAVSLGAGVMLYVAASELIPSGGHRKQDRAPLFVIVGVTLFVLTDFLVRRAGLQ